MKKLIILLLLLPTLAFSAGAKKGGPAGGTVEVVLVSQELIESDVSLATNSGAQGFTLDSQLTGTDVHVSVHLATAGTTCEIRMNTDDNFDYTGAILASEVFTPSVGWNKVTLTPGQLSAGGYTFGMVCDSGAWSRAQTDVYPGGDYKYNNAKSWIIISAASREWCFIISEEQ